MKMLYCVLTCSLLFFSCSIYYSKSVSNISEGVEAVSERVEKTDSGFSLFHPWLVLSEPLDADHLIRAIKFEYACLKLRNVEIDYYQDYYLLFGFPEVQVRADCIKK